jgi:hypothetical protein
MTRVRTGAEFAQPGPAQMVKRRPGNQNCGSEEHYAPISGSQSARAYCSGRNSLIPFLDRTGFSAAWQMRGVPPPWRPEPFRDG